MLQPQMLFAKCIEVSFNHLNLSKTEASFCFNCAVKSTNNNLQSLQNMSRLVPSLSCFESSIDQGIRGKHTFCSRRDSNSLTTERHTKICNNNEYITKTAEVFHNVSDCLGMKNPEFFFALINRESRFQLTAESKTGASCYGQLTGIAIADINERFIPFKVPSTQKPSCKSITDNWENLTTNNNRKTRSTICKMSSNPYACLTYSAIYYQQAIQKARNLVDDMDYIKVSLESRPEKSMMFKDEKSLRKYLRNNPKEKITKKQRLSIFKDKELVSQALALQGYNGGPESVRNLFKNYVNNIKGFTWSSKNPGKSYKQQIFRSKPHGISFSDFVKTFSDYNKKYSRLSNRRENASFVKDILKDYKSVTRYNSSCGNVPVKAIYPENKFTAPVMI